MMRIGLTLIALGLSGSGAHALDGTFSQNFTGSSGSTACYDECTGSGRNKVCTTVCPAEYTLVAFGDSIFAGYEPGFIFPGQIKSAVGYYADLAAAPGGLEAEGSYVAYTGYTRSGAVTSRILSDLQGSASQRNALATSDIVMMEAGGNDFLQARDAFTSSCNVENLETAMTTWRANYVALLDYLAANAKPGAILRTMNLYYPGVNADRSGSCGSTSYFATFLPLFLEAADYMCIEAEARGFRCADTVASMNCDQQADGSWDPDCPTSVADLQVMGSDNFRDGNAVYRTGPETCTTTCTGGKNKTCTTTCTPGALQLVDLIQSDNVHPNDAGHRGLAAVLGVEGYAP